MSIVKRISRTGLACPACTSLPIGARCPARCERNFVFGGWSSSLKHSSDAGLITAADYPSVMHVQLAKICTRPESRVLVAYGDVEDSFLGFIAGEPAERVVYYCFVKENFRRQGVAKELFAALGIDPRSRFAYPSETRVLTHGPRLKRKIPLAVYDLAVGRYPKQLRHRSYAA